MRAGIRSSQAECHSHLKQYEQAVQNALQATEEDRSFGVEWHMLSFARHSLQQYEEAVTCLAQALELGLPAVHMQQAQELLKRARAGAAEEKVAAAKKVVGEAAAAALLQGAAVKPSTLPVAAASPELAIPQFTLGAALASLPPPFDFGSSSGSGAAGATAATAGAAGAADTAAVPLPTFNFGEAAPPPAKPPAAGGGEASRPAAARSSCESSTHR